ncbi:MAG: poly-beta-1,6-N-acetyl-D-glucosamine N-deacetylase PgaB, partial [Gemmatimonadota bacterium]
MSAAWKRAVFAVLLLLGAGSRAFGEAPAGRESGLRSLPAARTAPAPGQPLIAILCYHDVSGGPGTPTSTISPAALRDQIRGLRKNGWTILPLSELLSRRGNVSALPPRVAVLTFDDGYRSFLDNVLPVLRAEGAKATLAVADALIDRPPADMPPLMSWDGIRKAERSGLVEIASHSHALHRYETSNPYGDTGPSVPTRRYLAAEGRYEDRDEYRNRIRMDLREARRRLRRELGHDVSVLAWPYGEHNAMARAIAAQEGFATTLGLDGTDVRAEDLGSAYLPRVMVFRGLGVGADDMRWLYEPRRPVRAAQVDLDAVYDPDPAAFRANVDRMVAHVRAIGATHAVLQACPDPDGNGFFRQAWFMNHQVPVKADIWSMVAAKLSHAGVAVWIRAPSMNLPWAWEKRPDWRIPFRRGPGEKGPDPWYFRVSPDIPGARRAAVDFLADIAVYLPIQGVLFDDDAYMLGGESLAGSGASSPDAKSEAMRALVEELKAAVLAWRPQCRFARNIYAPAAERDGIHPDFSQDFGQFLRDYDLTVVMAYARMEGHGKDAGDWAVALGRRATARWIPPPGQERWAPPVMLKFQAYDWSDESWVPGEELAAMVRG